MTLNQIPIGNTVLLEWNWEPVRLVHRSDSRATIKSLVTGDERDISPGCDVLPYESRTQENQEPAVTDQLIVKGQVFKLRTFHDLVLMIVRLRYEHGLNDIAKRKIIEAGRRCGLLSAKEDDLPYRGRSRGPRPTPKYWALLDDDAEKLARELTGWSPRVEGFCACGCGRVVRGRAKTATLACRKRLSRLVA